MLEGLRDFARDEKRENEGGGQQQMSQLQAEDFTIVRRKITPGMKLDKVRTLSGFSVSAFDHG
jgi:hypothetical protein